MRELVKSALSLGWALSLLGAKQAYSLVATNGVSSGETWDPITKAAVGQLDDSMKRVHRYASNLESQAVDMAFSFSNPSGWINPQRWTGWKPTANCGEAKTYSTPIAPEDKTPQARKGGDKSGDSNGCHESSDYGSSE